MTNKIKEEKYFMYTVEALQNNNINYFIGSKTKCRTLIMASN